MKKTVWLAFVLLLVCMLSLSGCDTLNLRALAHVHEFADWTQVTEPTCTDEGIMESCCYCG